MSAPTTENGDMPELTEDERIQVAYLRELHFGTRSMREGIIVKLADRLEHAERELDEARKLHTFDEWHEDDNAVLWWMLPVCEPPYVGTPNDSGWPSGCYTHWTRLLDPIAASLPTPKQGDKSV